MNLSIVFRPVAKKEFRDAITWYQERDSEKSQRFVAAVEQFLSEIAEHPKRFPIVRDDVRQVLVLGFPYSIIYRIKLDCIEVIGVFHTSRNPSVWHRRL